MSRYDSRRSRSPGRRSRSPGPSHRRSRSPGRRHRHSRSPGKRRRGSPDYGKYREREERRRPAWIDGDISEDDIREQAAGDPVEFRRLKRLKLNERGVRNFWVNSPTPSPSPERRPKHDPRSKDGAVSGDTSANGELEDARQLALDAQKAADARPSSAIHDEILALGPEVSALHLQAADLFKAWLAEQKAAAAEAEKRRKQEEADNVVVGPVLEASEKAAVDYGTHMRPGEGTAMAAYVQSGKRIPRRGEVGMSADQISTYEELGYVMSGSRHNRMNAIRIRKENQVYTAEEKAALAMFNMEENKRKEQKILSDMQRLVQRTLGETEEVPEEEAADQAS